MFQLQVADTDVSGGSIAVSWCLDQELLKSLADNQITDPQVVLVVAPIENYSVRKEFRKVVPLKDLMVYLELRVTGANKIFGFITTFGAKATKSRWLSKSQGEYEDTLLYDYGNGFELPSEKTCSSEPIDITVPDGIFAPEPSVWEKTWVNHFFRYKTIDQCDFRRRRLFAYGVQPLIFAGTMLFQAIILLAGLLFGARNWSAKTLLHPISYPILDVFEIFSKGTIFIRHCPEDDEPCGPSLSGFKKSASYIFRSFWSLPLMPVIFAPLALLIWFYTGIVLALGLVIVVSVFIGLSVIWLVENNRSVRDAFEGLLDRLGRIPVSDDLWYLNQEEQETLVCSDKPAPTFAKLPRKSIRLRFQNVKSKVCRPFSA